MAETHILESQITLFNSLWFLFWSHDFGNRSPFYFIRQTDFQHIARNKMILVAYK